MGKEYRILEIQDQDKKSTWAREVLESLPDWFGNREALEEIGRASCRERV